MRIRLAIGGVAIVSLVSLSSVEPLAALSNSVISGSVLDAEGRPINGAVLLKPLDPSGKPTQTNSEYGHFLFRPVQPGEYEIVIAPSGFKPRTLHRKVSAVSSWIDLGSVVLQAESFPGSIVIPYEPSTAPAWLKADPHSIFLSDIPQLPSCTTGNHRGRRIPVDQGWADLFVPRFAHVTKKAGFEGDVWHRVWFGPQQNHAQLLVVYGQQLAGLPWQHAPPKDTAWTKSKKMCHKIEIRDSRGFSTDGRRWRYVTLFSGVALYDGVPSKAADYFDKILETLCCGEWIF